MEPRARRDRQDPHDPGDRQAATTTDSAACFAGVEGRGTLDYALRTVQQTQNHLSAMADTKASIMITVCSIVLTLAIARLEVPALRGPLVILIASVLAALLFAVLAVLPMTGAPRRRDGTVDVADPSFNLFFFGHFAELPRDRFETLLGDVARDDANIYATLARDIYGQGVVLARRKFRMLRWSYITFVTGILAAAIAALATTLLASP